VIESVDGQHLRVRGVSAPVLNLASFDFLGLSLDLRIKHVAKEALEFYGVGSCGPRGFYGTIDQHLFFEQAIAKFMGTQVLGYAALVFRSNADCSDMSHRRPSRIPMAPRLSHRPYPPSPRRVICCWPMRQ